MSLADITLREYLTLSEQERSKYEAVLKHLKPVNNLGGGEIVRGRMTYGTVKRCLRLIQKGKDFDDFKRLYCMAFEISEDALLADSVKNFFAAQNFVLNFFVNLHTKEAALLQSINADDALWSAAGGDKLNRFGAVMPLVQLAEVFGLWPFDLETRPYDEVLTLLVILKERDEVRREYQQLKQAAK